MQCYTNYNSITVFWTRLQQLYPLTSCNVLWGGVGCHHSMRSISTSWTHFHKVNISLSVVGVLLSSLNTFRGKPCSSGHCWQMLSRCYTLPLAVRRREVVSYIYCIICMSLWPGRNISAWVNASRVTYVISVFSMTLEKQLKILKICTYDQLLQPSGHFSL